MVKTTVQYRPLPTSALLCVSIADKSLQTPDSLPLQTASLCRFSRHVSLCVSVHTFKSNPVLTSIAVAFMCYYKTVLWLSACCSSSICFPGLSDMVFPGPMKNRGGGVSVCRQECPQDTVQFQTALPFPRASQTPLS